MKKSLVLIMALALATSVQAALTLSLSAPTSPVGDTVTLSITSDDTSNWQGDLVLSEDTYIWADPIAFDWCGTGTASGIGNCGSVTYDYCGYHAAIHLVVASNLSPTDVVAGTQFSFDIIGVQAGWAYISLQDDATYEEISANGPLFIGIPEPMTVALLVLGGLMIRRRGKI
jgi:hypothetical protein